MRQRYIIFPKKTQSGSEKFSVVETRLIASLPNHPIRILRNETFPIRRLRFPKHYLVLQMMTDRHRKGICSIQIFNAL